jgi:serine/threonine protein kinase
LIGFAGAVTTNKPQFEVLTPLFDLATNSHDTLALKPIARALGATRAALGSLKEYYTGLRQQKPASSVDPKFPSRTYYTNRDGTKVEFEYQSRLDNEKLLFLVLNRPEEQILLVKFTQKYSEEAHAHCASHGVAPELYAVEQLGGGWMMVVMEYLDEDMYTHMYELRASRRASLRTAVTDAVSTLHQGNFVHGDIRHVNMLVSRNNGVKLIDFDWAGPEGTTRYPANVNHEGICRPEDARDGQLITREHDMKMVGFIFD